MHWPTTHDPTDPPNDNAYDLLSLLYCEAGYDNGFIINYESIHSGNKAAAAAASESYIHRHHHDSQT